MSRADRAVGLRLHREEEEEGRLVSSQCRVSGEILLLEEDLPLLEGGEGKLESEELRR